MKIKFVNSSIYIFSFLFFVLPIFNNFEHLLFKNSFSEINSRIPGGIKISIDEGLTSYGMFEVGYSSLDKKYNGQSLENNIYEYTESINVKFLEEGVVPESSKIQSYQKGHGLYTRVLPFVVYKITSIFSEKYIFLELTYVLISLAFFFRIYKSIQNNFGFIRSILFFIVLITNSYFIMTLKNVAGPFFISMWILYFLTFYKIRYLVYQKESLPILVFLFLPPTFLGNTLGPIIWTSFLAGSYLFEKNFSALKSKALILKALFINGILFILSELLWIVQRIVFLNQDFMTIKNVLISSFGKYFNITTSTPLNSCSEITWIEFLNMFNNIKMNDFIFFEVKLFHYYFIISILFLISKFNFDNSFKSLLFKNAQILFIFFIIFIWFALIKGAFSCHLHVYPKLFILAFLPIIFTFEHRNGLLKKYFKNSN